MQCKSNIKYLMILAGMIILLNMIWAPEVHYMMSEIQADDVLSHQSNEATVLPV